MINDDDVFILVLMIEIMAKRSAWHAPMRSLPQCERVSSMTYTVGELTFWHGGSWWRLIIKAVGPHKDSMPRTKNWLLASLKQTHAGVVSSLDTSAYWQNVAFILLPHDRCMHVAWWCMTMAFEWRWPLNDDGVLAAVVAVIIIWRGWRPLELLFLALPVALIPLSLSPTFVQCSKV
jgi:hypothetical protein